MSRAWRSGVWKFRVQSSGSRSLAIPVSEFHNMEIHEGNEHRESSNKSKFGDLELQGSEFWGSGARSLVFPISEFCNMVIHEGNEHRESRNKSQRLDIQHSSSQSGQRWSLDIWSSEFPILEPHNMGYEGGKPRRTQEQEARVWKSSIWSFSASNLST